MAHRHPHDKVWLRYAQASLQRCSVVEIWVNTREATLTWPVWGFLLSGSCILLPKRALPLIRYNQVTEVRDITTQLLTEVCPNVGIESDWREFFP